MSHGSCSGFCRGTQLLRLQPRPASRAAGVLVITAAKSAESLQDRIPTERLRLNNLSPQPGARRPDKRKGRGYGAGQVSSKDNHPDMLLQTRTSVKILSNSCNHERVKSQAARPQHRCERREVAVASVCEDRSLGLAVEPPGRALREVRHPCTGRCPSCAVLQEVCLFSCSHPSAACPCQRYTGAQGAPAAQAYQQTTSEHDA